MIAAPTRLGTVCVTVTLAEIGGYAVYVARIISVGVAVPPMGSA